MFTALGRAEAVQQFPSSIGLEANTFYAYVKADERLVVTFAGLPVVRVTNPLGTVTTGNGTRAAIGTSGIWKIEKPSTGTYTWRVAVLESTGITEKQGRVWFESHSMDQTSAINLTLWAVNLTGYIYKIDLKAFNGIYNRIRADAVGVPEGTTCLPKYASVDWSGSGTGGSHYPPFLDCGSGYKIFPEQPDPTLPATALTASGTDWLLPPPVDADSISVTNFRFERNVPMSSDGVFRYDMDGFAGNYSLQIDTDNNGTFDDPIDREFSLSSGPETNMTVPFDGKDGSGNVIPVGSTFSARMFFRNAGEMHLVLDDVEYIGGLTMTRTNGPAAPNSIIYWNDTDLSTTGRSTPTSPLDGRAGFDSNTTNGIHGWPSGSGTQWGDERRMDNWAFGPALDHVGALITIVPPAVMSTKTASPSSGSPVLPGNTVAYSLTFTAPVDEAVTVNTSDSLADVLDDADLVGSITSSNPSVVVGSLDPSGVFSITGTLAAGASAVVTYQVHVKDFADQSDHILTNVLLCDQFQLGCGPRITTHPVAQLTLEHTATTPSGTLVRGEQVEYSYLVTNTGKVELSNISITEESFTGSGTLSTITCPPVNLPVLTSITCTATYLTTQVDVNTSSVVSNAHAVGLTPTGSVGEQPLTVLSAPDSVTLSAVPGPSLALTKSVSPVDGSLPLVGQHLNYQFLVTNTGNVSISGVGIDELTFTGTASPTITCPAGAAVLEPAASVTCSAEYVLTQTDVDAGFVSNTARANGVDPSSTTIQSNVDSASIQFPQSPSLGLVKSADVSTLIAGGTVVYSYTATNTGNVTLNTLNIQETSFDGRGTAPAAALCGTTTLAPGASTNCTTTYLVVQADIDAGSVTNKARAQAKQPSGTTVLSSEAVKTLSVVAAPGLSLVKTANPNTAASYQVGQEIEYLFAVQNTGNVTLTGIGVEETGFTGRGSAPAAPTCLATSLVPGASTNCTTTYELTQSDIDAESVTNKAKAIGTKSDGGKIESAEDTAVIGATAQPSLSLLKTASTTTLVVGNSVNYTFAVQNTGNVTLWGIGIDETSFNGHGTAPTTPTCGELSLAPGASTTCTTTYQVVQADVDAGTVTNKAKAHAYAGNKPVGSNESQVRLDALQAPAISVVKSASPNTTGSFTVGRGITYSFTVRNEGNVTLNNVGVTETDFDGNGTAPLVPTCGSTLLAPGATTTCTTSYTLVQADIDDESVTNKATAQGTPPVGGPVTSAEAEVTIGENALPALSLVKSANTSTLVAGETVTYSYQVQNIGNATLHNVEIDETTFTGHGTPPAAPTCTTTTLAPGISTNCISTYQVVQADIDAGSVTNQAKALALSPSNVPIASNESSKILTAQHAPGISLAKTATPSNSASFTRDRVVTYSYVVQNTGNVTLNNVGILETAFDGNGTPPALPSCAVTVLLPGATTTCTTVYQLVQGDIDEESVTNKAKSQGTPPAGAAIESAEDEVTIGTPGHPALSLQKTANTATLVAGSTVTYTFTIQNTGNVTLSNVGIDETGFDGNGNALAAPTCGSNTLAPNALTTCTVNYQVVQADVDAGSVTNKAKAHGKPLMDAAFQSAEDEVVLTAVPAPSLSLVKTASPNTTESFIKDQIITYSYAVQNTGNVTLVNLGITETSFDGNGAAPAPPSCPKTTLAPGDATTCTTTYQLVQGDINDESVTNKAIAQGTPPAGGVTQSAESLVQIMAQGLPAIAVTKSANTAGLQTPVPWAGDTVTYNFTLINTGNVTLHDAQILDDLSGLSAITYSWPNSALPGVLDPGEVATASATYDITQEDLHAGQVENTAFGNGKDPADRPVVDVNGAYVAVPLATATSLVLTRSVRLASAPPATRTPSLTVTSPVDLLYDFTIHNAGNVTISQVGLDHDAFTGAGLTPDLSCPASETLLVPGASTDCTVGYQHSQDDVDAGDVLSTAKATGQDPQTQPVVSNTAHALVEATHLPQVTMTIATSLTEVADYVVGAPVVFTIVATNIGNVTLYNPGIEVASFTGAGPLSAIDCPPLTSLSLGETMTCTANYALTQADIDAREIRLETVALGTSPGSRAVGGLVPTRVPSPSDEVIMIGIHAPQLELLKSYVLDVTTEFGVGSQILYTFTVTNSGNVTLSNVDVAESVFTGTGIVSDPVCPLQVLAPAEEMVCTATYTLLPEDLVLGNIDNTALSTANAPIPVGATEPEALAAESSIMVLTPLPAEVTTSGTVLDTNWSWLVLLILGSGLLLISVAVRRKLRLLK